MTDLIDLGGAGTPSITVVILTYNEAIHLARALASVAQIARGVVVIDSGSTDATVAIAEAARARVLVHPFVNQAEQFQWGVDHAAITTDWVLRLDADEVIEPDLADEIRRRLPGLPGDVTGVTFQRKHIFMDRWIRHGGRYPLVMLRLFRTGRGRVESRWMDEHIVVDGGRTVAFAGGFADINLHDLGFFTDKHNKYATREAIERLSARHDLLPEDRSLNIKTASRQASRKRAIKGGFYNRLPLGVGPALYFLWRYVGQLGFLDGRPGLIYHFLQGFWYRFLVDARTWELERGLAGARDTRERLERLSRMTGHDLVAMARTRAAAAQEAVDSGSRNTREPMTTAGLPE